MLGKNLRVKKEYVYHNPLTIKDIIVRYEGTKDRKYVFTNTSNNAEIIITELLRIKEIKKCS